MEIAGSSRAVHARVLLPNGTPRTASESSHSPTQRSRRANKRLACRECRQCKIRCEGSDRRTCRRCQQLSLTCVYDNGFRRTSKHSKLEELAKQVEHLQATLSSSATHVAKLVNENTSSTLQNGDEAPSPGVQYPGMTQSALASPSQEGVGRETASQRLDPVNAHHVEELPCLGSTRLPTAVVNQAFKTFFTRYNPFMPILDDSITPSDYFSRSPLLFWTIITIAARRSEKEPTVLSAITPDFRQLLWQTIGSPPHSRHDLKAMILLCLWPLPTSSMSTDISYLLASLAKASAMHVGIHKPFQIQDFSRVRTSLSLLELKDALTTWTACFVAAEIVTTFLGHPPLFVADTAIELVSKSISQGLVPQALYEVCNILQLCNKFHRAMASADSLTITTLIPIYAVELRELRTQLGSHMSKRTHLVFLYACLQLRSYHFLVRNAETIPCEGILDGYQSATSIIQELSRQDPSDNPLMRGPIIYQNALVMASVFVFKILRSRHSRLVDFQQGQKIFKLSIVLIRKSSIEDNDLSGRMSKILLQLWSRPADSKSFQDELGVQTRLAGSLLQDLLWQWRDSFGLESTCASHDAGLPPSPSPLEAEGTSNLSSQAKAAGNPRKTVRSTSLGTDQGIEGNMEDNLLWHADLSQAFTIPDMDVWSFTPSMDGSFNGL